MTGYGFPESDQVRSEGEQGTVSTMTQLSDEQRITEIAQMLSGSDVSQAAVDNAKSLLAL